MNSKWMRWTQAATTMALVALGTSGCVSGSSSTTSSGGGTASQAMKASGAMSGAVGSDAFTIDYTGLTVQAALTHKINTDKGGIACVPVVNLAVEKSDGTCRLDLEFRAGFDGTTLDLAAAKFTAIKGITQGGAVIKTLPCAGWPVEPKKGAEVVYEKVSGSGSLSTPTLGQPEAGAATATIKGLDLQPSGVVKMKYLGRQFDLDLSQLKFSGDVTSKGSNDAAFQCTKTTFDMPQWTLKDINPKSATFDQEVSLDDFKGKRIAVLMGAGWCASCVAQAEGMQKLKQQMGDDMVFIVLHDKDTASEPAMYKNLTIPVLRGDGWTLQKGKKNDGFFYAANGRQVGYFQGAGTVYTNVWEQWISTTASTAVKPDATSGAIGYNCSNGGAPGQFEKACAAVTE
jgi:thiol-disulfide isomerase/thioredoxin